MKLSTHFDLSEFIISQTAIRYGIENIPTPIVVYNLQNLCKYCLEPLGELLNESIYISSGYRCFELNKKVNGSKNSQHITGCAADIKVKGWNTESLYQLIKKSDIKFDQLIQEFDAWVHISYDANKLRGVCLRAVKEGEKTLYLKD